MVIQRGHRFSIFGDIQKPTGPDPEQPAGLDNLQKSLTTSSLTLQLLQKDLRVGGNCIFFWETGRLVQEEEFVGTVGCRE